MLLVMSEPVDDRAGEAGSGPVPRYYRSLEGRWAGTLTLRMTAWRALRGHPLATKVTMVSARLVSPVRMATTLEARGASFVHTTRVTKWGFLLYATEETIEVTDGGRALRMVGEQRPRLGPLERYEAAGEVDPSATRATYRIPWLGVELVQRTRVVAEGLELTQETPWSRSSVLLHRVG